MRPASLPKRPARVPTALRNSQLRTGRDSSRLRASAFCASAAFGRVKMSDNTNRNCRNSDVLAILRMLAPCSSGPPFGPEAFRSPPRLQVAAFLLSRVAAQHAAPVFLFSALLCVLSVSALSFSIFFGRVQPPLLAKKCVRTIFSRVSLFTKNFCTVFRNHAHPLPLTCLPLPRTMRSQSFARSKISGESVEPSLQTARQALRQGADGLPSRRFSRPPEKLNQQASRASHLARQKGSVLP